jgi:hypothetical protein
VLIIPSSSGSQLGGQLHAIIVYHYFQAADRNEAYQMPLELTEEEGSPSLSSSARRRRRGGRSWSSQMLWYSRWRRHHRLGRR